jgi:hypothetical protein
MEPVRSDLAGEDRGAIGIEHEETDDLLDRAFEAAIIRLVNSILTQAVRARASAIHIEPFERELRVRYRINGLLRKTRSPPTHLTAAITSPHQGDGQSQYRGTSASARRAYAHTRRGTGGGHSRLGCPDSLW